MANYINRQLIFILIISCSLFTGCGNLSGALPSSFPDSKPESSLNPPEPQPLYQPPNCEETVLNTFRKNRLPLSVIRTPRVAEKTVLFLAGIRGDETGAYKLSLQLDRFLRTHPEYLENRMVLIVPALNAYGIRTKKVYNANNVDLNRDFLLTSQAETVALVELIECFKPNWIIALRDYSLMDYDPSPNDQNPAIRSTGEVAREIAKVIAKDAKGLSVKRLGSEEGSLGYFAGRIKGIPTVSMGLPPAANNWSSEKLWQSFQNSLLAGISFEGTTNQQAPLPEPNQDDFQMAKDLFSQGNYSQAGQIFRQIPSCRECKVWIDISIRADSIVNRGKTALDKRRWVTLRREAQNLADINPSDSRIAEWRKRIPAPRAKPKPIQQREEPIKVAAKTMNPNSFETAKSLFEQGKYAQTLRILEGISKEGTRCQDCRTLQEDAKKSLEKRDLGISQMREGNHSLAVQSFEAVLKKNDKDPIAKANLKKSKEAIIESAYLSGKSKFDQGNLPGALDEWKPVPSGYKEIDRIVQQACAQVLLLTGKEHPRCP